MKIRKEADLMKDKPAFDQEKFQQGEEADAALEPRQEYFLLGQRNRGVAEMFAVIRANPQHPSLNEWINALEAQLSPPAPVTPAASHYRYAVISPHGWGVSSQRPGDDAIRHGGWLPQRRGHSRTARTRILSTCRTRFGMLVEEWAQR
jgi:hypothetical protein